MRLYMAKYGVTHDAFAPFALVAHANAATSPDAVFHTKRLDRATYDTARVIEAPIQVHVVCMRVCVLLLVASTESRDDAESRGVQLFDASPTCDGAAAVVLTSDPSVAARAGHAVRIAGSGAASG